MQKLNLWRGFALFENLNLEKNRKHENIYRSGATSNIAFAEFF
jgi:hypothetical protein